MKATEEDPVFISQAEPSKQLVKKMQDANEKLDKIQKGLSDYLEMKRLYFPRFFFLADEQMLEILSQSKEPRAVQPHLGKCFEGLNTIKFEKDLKITELRETLATKDEKLNNVQQQWLHREQEWSNDLRAAVLDLLKDRRGR